MYIGFILLQSVCECVSASEVGQSESLPLLEQLLNCVTAIITAAATNCHLHSSALFSVLLRISASRHALSLKLQVSCGPSCYQLLVLSHVHIFSKCVLATIFVTGKILVCLAQFKIQLGCMYGMFFCYIPIADSYLIINNRQRVCEIYVGKYYGVAERLTRRQ